VSFPAVTLSVASQQVFIVVVYFVMTQSGNFWIHPRKVSDLNREKYVHKANLTACVHSVQGVISSQALASIPNDRRVL
jgi:hypothetical protein